LPYSRFLVPDSLFLEPLTFFLFSGQFHFHPQSNRPPKGQLKGFLEGDFRLLKRGRIVLGQKALGPLKRKFWDLPGEVKSQIMKELEERFALLFEKLKVVGTKKVIQEKVKPFLVKQEIKLP
jgi:hypothetical protein